MQYSDTTYNQGIVEEIRFLTNTTSTNYSIENITRNVNRGLDRVAYLIQTSDQLWQFDDSNETDQPIATTDLFTDQTDYAIDQTFLKIMKVEIKNSAGVWSEIAPINVTDPEYLQVSTQTSGMPLRYDKNGNSILLYPAPNYDGDESLRVYYQRNMSYFDTSDTVKTPGFNPQFHRLLTLYASLDYAIAKDLPQANSLAAQAQKLEEDLMDFYSNRGKDEPPKIRAIRILSR